LFDAKSDIKTNIDQLEVEFEAIFKLACFDEVKSSEGLWDAFLNTLPEMLEKLNLDATACLNFDPASKSIEEVYIAYPGFFAIAIHRFCHQLYKLNIPLMPRLMSEYAHRLTGVDIHPGATIGDSFFIDHATGIVIGETCIIKTNVKVYQGVTLGALQVNKSMQNTKRHPTVEDNVIIYANATILGGETVIGANSIIGGNVWVTKTVPENSFVYHNPETKMKVKREDA
jgi:serine O-acetyltransferase